MNQAQLEQLTNTTENVLTGAMLGNQSDRTLIYGYTTERDTFHVYLLHGVIHVLVYESGFNFADRPDLNRPSKLVSHQTEAELSSNHQYVPNKRVYPAACDYEFCAMLMRCGVNIPFTTYEPRPETSFHGQLHTDPEFAAAG